MRKFPTLVVADHAVAVHAVAVVIAVAVSQCVCHRKSVGQL